MAWTTQTLLAAIGAAQPRDCFTHADMAKATGLTVEQVANAANNLRRHGFVTSSVKGCHKLTDAGRAAIVDGANLKSGPKGPQQSGQRRRNPGLRQRVWNCLRIGKKVTIDDIIMRVVEGDERDPRSNVGKYLTALERAGFVRAMPLREAPCNATSNGCKRWWLVIDAGPLAPAVRASRLAVYDPNRDVEVPYGSAPYDIAEEGTL